MWMALLAPVFITVGLLVLHTAVSFTREARRARQRREAISRHMVELSALFLLPVALLCLPLTSFVGTEGRAEQQIPVALGGVILTLLFFWMEGKVWGWIFAKRVQQDTGEPLAKKQSVFYVPSLLLVALEEEIIWRGALLASLAVRMSPLLAIVVSGVHFGLTHFYHGAFNAISKSLLGCLWGLAAWWFGGIFLPLLLHVLYNVLYVLFTVVGEKRE